MPTVTQRYRPDIEGLRALAILMVVAAHAGVPAARGGFIGVDVFFVISGFLITRLLVDQQRDSGRIDFAGFYARRIRRLLPAFLVVLLVSAVLGWQLLPPSVQRSQAIAGMASALWLSNLHFAFADIGYFEPGSETNLYLHTWSLGVEEQFYLVWPMLVAWVLAWGDKSSDRRRIAAAMAALLLVSFVAEIWLTRQLASKAFYLMPTRAWQFAAGALTYLLADFRGALGRRASVFAAVIGAVLISYGLVTIEPRMAYPGSWALLPTLGACLVIAAGGAVSNPITFVLSLRPMQFIGRISYSLYLWHWPVLILGASLVTVTDLEYRISLAGLSLLLAMASYWWIEAPLRRNPRLVSQPSRTIIGAFAAMVLVIAGYATWANAAQQKQRANAAHMQSQYRISVPRIYAMGCDDWYASAELHVCEFGSPVATNTVVVMGDSIGLQWFPALERIFKAPDWRLLVLTKSSCPMVDRPIYYDRIGREYTECAIWRQRGVDYIEKLSPTLVILGSTHTAHYSKEDWIAGTESLLKKISPYAGRIIMLRSTPHLPFHGAECLEPRGVLHGWLVPSDSFCAAPPDNAVSDRVAAWIAEAAQSIPNVTIVQMDDLVCPEGLCHAALNDKLVYRDAQHLNADFVAGLAIPLAERMGLQAAPQ